MPDNSLLLSRARSAVIARDFALATRLYKQLLRDDRDNIQLLNQLGDLYMKSGKDDQALTVFKRISELNPDDATPLITMGGIYRRLKMFDESIGALEQALVADGTNAQISYNLGFTYKLMGQLEDAISCFEEAIELNPEDVLAYNHLGTIYAQQNDNEKAVQSYLRGLNVDANHPVLLLNIAKSYEAIGDYEKACASYEGALRSKPLWVDAIDGLGRLLISLSRVKEAYSLVQRAIAVNSKDQKLQSALENIKSYMDNPPAPQKTDSPLKEIPSIFSELPKVEDEEFDSNGLEIQLDQDDFSSIEDDEIEAMPDDTNTLKASHEAETAFDFSAMGMDNLANDTALDPLFFQQAEEQIIDAEPDVENLDSLVDNMEVPFDTEEIPDGDSGVFTEDSSFFADEAINPATDSVTQLNDGAFEEDPQFGGGEPQYVDSAEPAPEEELKALAEELKEQVEKANYAAEKAWEAAQQAADSAQILDDAARNALSEADEDNLAGETADDSDEDTSLQEIIEKLPSIISQLETPEEFEKYRVQLEMFRKLRELLEYLPEGKKQSFLSSKTRLLLDYIIARLSGTPGLLVTVNALVEAGLVKSDRQTASVQIDEAADASGTFDQTDWDEPLDLSAEDSFETAPFDMAAEADSPEEQSAAEHSLCEQPPASTGAVNLTGDELLAAGLDIIRNLAASLPDENLRIAMQMQLERLSDNNA